MTRELGPLLFSDSLIKNINPRGKEADVGRILDRVVVNRVTLQDFKPLSQSLEWEISSAYWNEKGAQPFAENEVPFIINNSGRLSENAASVLYANCIECPVDGEIIVVELGAGSGLFSKYFLDSFREICRQEKHDYYDRLVLIVSDRSPQSIIHWKQLNLFQEHRNHVKLGVIDAQHPSLFSTRKGEEITLTGVRAIFCNYLLDVLPTAVVRRGENGCEQLYIRTHLAEDQTVVSKAARMSLEQIRKKVESDDYHDRAELADLLHAFDLETAFLSCNDDKPVHADEAIEFSEAQQPVLLNHGAIECLYGCYESLEDNGFVMINDYGSARRTHSQAYGIAQRFGSTVAAGINFPFLEYLFDKKKISFLKPEERDDQALYSRLLVKNTLPRTTQAFHDRFGNAVSEYFERPLSDARKYSESGDFNNALDSYKTALARSPRDWAVIGEIAEFVGLKLKDFNTGIEMIRESISINPWYSSWLWNVLGDCLFSLERFDHAHEAYLQAQRINPFDPRTNLNLAYTYLQFGEYQEALSVIAIGLSHDQAGSYRSLLLDKQQQILSSLSNKWIREQEQLISRTKRFFC